MKTNGPCINHPALSLKNLSHSDTETKRVNFKTVVAQPPRALGRLSDPHGLKPLGPTVRFPRMTAAITSAPVCSFLGPQDKKESEGHSTFPQHVGMWNKQPKVGLLRSTLATTVCVLVGILLDVPQR